MFSAPSSSQTAPMFAGLIERKAEGAAATSLTALPRTLPKRGAEAAPAGLRFMLARPDQESRRSGIQYRRASMPQLGLGRAITLASQHMQANFLRPSLALTHQSHRVRRRGAL